MQSVKPPFGGAKTKRLSWFRRSYLPPTGNNRSWPETRKVFLGPVLLAALFEESHSEGQSIHLSGITYISIGATISFDGSRNHGGWVGMELSIGTFPEVSFEQEAYLLSLSLGAQASKGGDGSKYYAKLNGGYPWSGGSIGITRITLGEEGPSIGLETDVWAGLFAYATGSFSLNPIYSGFGWGAKMKIPVPVKSQRRWVWDFYTQ